MVGYTGGHSPSPTYESVCDGDGHTEALQIEYDETKTSYEQLLHFYWENYQGSSSSPQYKAAIWVHDEAQRAAALKYLEAATMSLGGVKPDVEIVDAVTWHDAEEYHQQYHYKASL
eukprot:gnl/TRDRNA2_/TRDRNA2_90990_c0_seq1.p1 gnl/TRDRNA2_/TRDRNA2_90990_c0~~gnl/TRDRNA2_/TRDRNA2_90990_c0_seq1.p1  ORF type:complete len:116 (-),score=24.10 gnl/TRDRNA2_/TRDRNA2_90990_c0_seq1:181-528(-)